MQFGTVNGRFVLVTTPPDGRRALDVATASGGSLPSDAVGALARWDDVVAWSATADWSQAVPVTPEQLGPPVPAPRQVFAIALNYRPTPPRPASRPRTNCRTGTTSATFVGR